MSELFNTEQERLLAKTLALREKIIDNLVADELPTKEKDINAITNLLESIDRSIYQKVKLNVEDRAVDANSADKEMLLQLLFNLHNETAQLSDDTASRSIEYQPSNIDINQGELIRGKDNISPDEIVG